MVNRWRVVKSGLQLVLLQCTNPRDDRRTGRWMPVQRDLQFVAGGLAEERSSFATLSVLPFIKHDLYANAHLHALFFALLRQCCSTQHLPLPMFGSHADASTRPRAASV